MSQNVTEISHVNNKLKMRSQLPNVKPFDYKLFILNGVWFKLAPKHITIYFI